MWTYLGKNVMKWKVHVYFSRHQDEEKMVDMKMFSGKMKACFVLLHSSKL